MLEVIHAPMFYYKYTFFLLQEPEHAILLGQNFENAELICSQMREEKHRNLLCSSNSRRIKHFFFSSHKLDTGGKFDFIPESLFTEESPKCASN